MCIMAARMRTSVVRRPSLPLTPRDEEGLASVRTSVSYQQALERLTGEPIEGLSVSEAALLHAIFEAGLLAVRAEAEEQGYAEIAAAQGASGRQAQARRRAPSWAEEE